MTIVILYFDLNIEYIIVRKMLIIYILIKIIFANEIKNKYLIIMLSKNLTIYIIINIHIYIFLKKPKIIQ
jgi:hypothetical protein